MSYLIVVAHPDDEVLGAGATICKLTSTGVEVNVCILSAQAQARTYRPSDDKLEEDTKRCMALLGVRHVVYGTYPNIKLNSVPHLELVQFIEKVIVDTKADVIITHHPGDLNNDHLHTSLACQAAARLFQRSKEITPLKQLLFMEIPSSTEWGLNSSLKKFEPNTFVEIGEEYLERKIKALSYYEGVMRKYPHPRSKEVLTGLAAYRGGQAGLNYAEAFECVFRRIE